MDYGEVRFWSGAEVRSESAVERFLDARFHGCFEIGARFPLSSMWEDFVHMERHFPNRELRLLSS